MMTSMGVFALWENLCFPIEKTDIFTSLLDKNPSPRVFVSCHPISASVLDFYYILGFYSGPVIGLEVANVEQSVTIGVQGYFCMIKTIGYGAHLKNA